ncbi:MAG: CoA ester lyase [Gemmatimonadota bacterium]
MTIPRIRRSILFVPADRPDRYPKALASRADSICIDLEDAVGPSAKGHARDAVLSYLRERTDTPAEVVLRINSPRTEDGLRDVLALREADGGAPDALIIPKVDSAAEVGWVLELLPPWCSAVRLIVMIETARGLARVEKIATASDRIDALLLGAVDLSAELGSTRGWDSLLYARSRVVHAAALAEIDAIDVPRIDVGDDDAERAESVAVARLGFAGKAAIHPRQIPLINEAFTPTTEEVAQARRIVEAYEQHGGAMVLLDGSLVERPVVRSAQRTLAIADRTPEPL